MSSQTVSTKLRKIAWQAIENPERVFTTLAHLIDVEFLEEAYRRTRKSGAPGCDGVTAKMYAEDLEANLQDLYDRMRSGQYKAPPVERVWIEKEDGKQRPIGKPTFEDKIVQRAVAMILEAIFERNFHDHSYGFRRGRGAHQALKILRTECKRTRTTWIIDADISGFFDSIDHTLLRELLQQRVNDGTILRFIGKWLNAGVLEEGQLSYSDAGTPQGGVISPILANVFLHYVLDEWFEKEVKPRMKGDVFLVRYADDFVIGCEREDDAQRIMAVLPKRFARHHLTIHPEKTRLVAFAHPRRPTANRRPPRNASSAPSAHRGAGPSPENGTFDFLGFTHYWGRTRHGGWAIKRRTSKKRLRRSCRRIWQWCQKNRHRPLSEQYWKLTQKLRGHYQYYGVRCNYARMSELREFTTRAWHYWLNKRTRGNKLPWEKFKPLLVIFDLPRPKITHNDV